MCRRENRQICRVEEGASSVDRGKKPARGAMDSAMCKAVLLSDHFGLFISNFDLKGKVYPMG
jgi:hypothetical protein